MALGEKQVLGPTSGAPVHAVVPPRRTPWACYALIGACVAMAGLDKSLAAPDPVTDQLLQWGALYGPAVAAGQWYRLLGHVIEHGGAIHLLFNMSVVFTLGFQLERAIASWRFALLSVVTALGSATMALAFRFDTPMVGASGMILGWAGTMLPISNSQGRRQLSVWLVQVAAISLIPGVSWEGHLGGFLFGLPCGLLLRNRARWFPYGIPVLIIASAGAAVWVVLRAAG